MSEGNLCHWTTCAANLLEQLWRKIHEQVLRSLCLHADETPVRRLKGRNKEGYMWLATSADDGKSLYMWSETREAETSDRLLRHGMEKDGNAYDGILVTDGYIVYDTWVQGLPGKQRPAARNRQTPQSAVRPLVSEIFEKIKAREAAPERPPCDKNSKKPSNTP